RGIRTPAVSVGFGWNGTSRPEVGLAVNADTLMFGKIAIRELDMVGGGYQDSLRWSGTATLGAATKFSGSGEYWTTAPGPVISFDSLLATLPSRGWRLEQPASVELQTDRYRLNGVKLAATDGSGSVQLEGAIPRSGVANLGVSIYGLQLKDV